MKKQLSISWRKLLCYFVVLLSVGFGHRSLAQSWTLQASPVTDNLNHVTIVTGNILFAVGDNGKIIKSENLGVTWSVIPGPTTDNIKKIVGVGTNTLFIATASSVYWSTNSGLNWQTLISSTLQSPIVDIGYRSGDVIGLDEQGSVYKLNSLSQNSPTLLYDYPAYLSGDAIAKDMYINDYIHFANKLSVRKLNNSNVASAGISNASTAQRNFKALAFDAADVTKGFMVGIGGGVDKTTDSGNNWARVATPGSVDLMDVAVSGNNVFVIGGNGNIYKSINNGSSWFNSGSGTTQPLKSILLSPADPLMAWVVGAGGTILRTTNGGACPLPLQPSIIVGPASINTGVQGNYSVSNVAGVTYNWFAGTGGVVTGTGNAVQIAWSSAGSKTITVTATTSCGTSIARTLAVTVITCALPTQPTLSQGSAAGCQFQSSSFSVNSVAGVSYDWSLSGGGVITGTGNTALVTWSTAGTFTVSVTPSNVCGAGPVRTINVTVAGTPASPSAISGNTTVCTGISTPYSITNVAGLTYTWDTGGAGTVSGSGNAVNVIWTSAGTKTLTLSATNACGSVTSRTQSVTVNPSPSQPSVIAGSTTVTTGISNQYSVTNEAGITYAWNAGTGGTVTGSGNVVNISWSSAGSKTITLTPSNSCGNGTPRTLSVTVNDCALPAQPSVITGGASACTGASGIYSVSDVGGVSYLWNAGVDGLVSGSGNSVTLSWTSVGSKTITVTPTNACGNGTARTLNITVSQLPAQPSIISGNTTPCKDASIAYSISNTAGVTYTWSVVGTGSISGSGNSVNVTWPATESHTLRVTPSNACGSGLAGTLDVTVKDVPSAASQISGITSVCTGSSTAYSVTNVPGVSYTWSGGSGSTITGSGSAVSISWSTGGTKTVSVTPSNSCGNGIASTKNVEVTTTPAQPSTITGSAAATGGVSQTYSVTNIPGVNYAWSTNADGVVSAVGNTAQVTWATSGTKTLTVTPSNFCGSGTARSLSVTTTVPCTIPGIPSSITLDPGVGTSTTISLNGFRRFVVGASAGSTSLNISVSPSTGTTITPVFGNTWDIQFTVPGTYIVSGFGETSGCGTGAPASITVTVCSGTVATPTAIIGPLADVCRGTTTRYSVTPADGIVFDWSLSGLSGTITPVNADRSIVDVAWSAAEIGGDVLTVRAKNACNVQSSSFSETVLFKLKPAYVNLGLAITGSVCAGSGGGLLISMGTPESGTTYTWQLNGSGTIAGDNLSVTALADGLSRNINLYGSNACFTNELITGVNYGGGTPVPVMPSPVAGPSTINVNTDGSYSVGEQAAGVNFSWYAGTDATITPGASGNIKNIQWSTGGLKTIEVSAVNSCGSQNRTYSVFVNGPCNGPSVPALISGPTTACAGVEYQFGVPSQGFDTFNWSAGADATITGSGSIRTIKWSTGGAKTISVTATNLCTTSAAQTLAVTVNTVPVQPTALTGSTSGCNGNTQQISLASPVGGVTYTWEVQGGTVATSGAQGQIADITWTSTGVNEVKLKPSNACGNGTPRVISITVNTVPVQPSLITGESEVCSATSKTYSVTNTPGVTYTWNAGSGGTVTGSGNSVSISWSTTGSKTITVTPSNGCGNGTARTLAVNVSGVPAQPSAISGLANAALGNEEVYTVSSVTGVNYVWSLSDKGTLTGSGNNASVFWNTAGSASLSVTPSNTCGNGTARVLPITVNKINQSITFSVTSPVTTTQSIVLNGEASSGLPVTYTSSNTAIAEIFGNELVIYSSGSINITASQPGDGTFAPASSVIRALTINKSNQVITFNALSATTYGEDEIVLDGTSDSGLLLVYSSSNTSVATVSGNVVSIVGAGSANITATQGGDAIFNAATPVVQSLLVNRADQSISFGPLSAKGINDPPFILSATSTSELAVAYSSSNVSVATVNGNTITIVGQGSTTITASQAGNANFNAASPVEQILVVNGKDGQTIVFNALPTTTFGDANFELNATASSTLAVSYTSSNENIASINGATVTIVGAGTVTITARQEGDEIFNPATPVQQTLIVNKADQSITFATLPAQALSNGSYTLTGTASSGLAVSYLSTDPGVATVSGTTVTYHSAGTTTLTAIQQGNENYNPAPSVDQELTITAKQLQTISFDALPAKTFGDAAFALVATASSDLPVLFESSNSSVATINGNMITIVGAGTAIISASQPGNTDFDAATIVSRELVVAKADQVITFNLPTTVNFTTGTLQLQATSNSGLPVSFSSSTSSIANISGDALTFVSPGLVEIIASQAGNANYNAAVNVVASITIAEDRQAIIISGSLDFGNVLLGETAVKTITVTNTGNANLEISAISLPAGYSTTQGATTINPGANLSIQISFTPEELKDYTGVLTVISNAINETNTMAISGTGSTITGFNEPGQASASLDVYPNPGNGVFIIKSRMAMNKSIAVVDLSGKAQFRSLRSKDEQHHELDILDLPQGVYYLKIEEKGSIAVMRIVKLN